MWLFHLHSAVKKTAFFPVFPLAGSTAKAFCRLSLWSFKEKKHQPFSITQPLQMIIPIFERCRIFLQPSSIMGKMQHSLNTPQWEGGTEEVQKNEKKPFRQIADTPRPPLQKSLEGKGELWGEKEALSRKAHFPLPNILFLKTRLSIPLPPSFQNFRLGPVHINRE